MNFTLTEVFIYWVLMGGVLSAIFKGPVARVFLKINLPVILLYFLILTPLALIEKKFTCEITPYSACIQTVFPALFLLFLILFFVQRLTRCNYKKIVILAGLLGWINEMILIDRINQLNLFYIVIFTALIIPVYGVLAILPAYYLEKIIKKIKK